MEKQKKLARTEIIIWPWSANKEGKYPIRIRVTHGAKRRYFPVYHDGLKLFLSDGDWITIQDSNVLVRGKNKLIRDSIESTRTTVKTAVINSTKNNRPFTWEKFEKELSVNESPNGFLTFWQSHLKTLLSENRTGTYSAYYCAYQAFKAFRNEIELTAYDITPGMLKEFELYLQKRGCGKTTQGMYARGLRVIYNLATDENPSLLESYPFARKQTDRTRYKIKTGSGHKGDALTIEQLQNFMAIETNSRLPEHEAKLLWLFSFHCQGMNMKDISLLKYINTKGNVIKYVRAKTMYTELSETVIEVPISDSIREIIAEIGNPDKRDGSYVFPIIPNGLAINFKRRTTKEKTPQERIDEIISQKIKMVNARLKALCGQHDLPGMTTYWARHSYANLLKETGESIDMIRELLGHSDIKTTESYLKRFDTSKKRAANERLYAILKAS